MKLPKELILDYNVWICGAPSPKSDVSNVLGEGETNLLNSEGYMCCLGQFCEQAGFDKENLLQIPKPSFLKETIEGLTGMHTAKYSTYHDTHMSIIAMSINDTTYTTVARKADLLKELLKEHGYTLRLVNFPKEKQ